ncbi:methyltransferase domain-containing protein [Vibrio sp. S4M6]|uniref:class I SAM-dependent methyltransferase n=1 Tax=Vibrio sinus TaxID=2946865 RepID=UPI00202A254A|nr:class I SAM-dependent methyltransferase [Vibrio sinus]MCL9783316.1 methyltransferase domain-containing protein [Vibrio sinus]
MTVEKLLEEYSQEYCQCLELAYGQGMMSEGGAEAIDKLFENIELSSRQCLEIGSGLGGTAYHLAESHNACVTGIEINDRMTQQARENAPINLREKLTFVTSVEPCWPFAAESFDVVFSKGVLTHVEDKKPVLKEALRVLKPGGHLVINDWLSSQSQWGEIMQYFCEVDDLTLFPMTKDQYQFELNEAGFTILSSTRQDEDYITYNLDIVERLKVEPVRSQFIDNFGDQEHRSHIEAFSLTAQAIRQGELNVVLFQCQKPQ